MKNRPPALRKILFIFLYLSKKPELSKTILEINDLRGFVAQVWSLAKPRCPYSIPHSALCTTPFDSHSLLPHSPLFPGPNRCKFSKIRRVNATQIEINTLCWDCNLKSLECEFATKNPQVTKPEKSAFLFVLFVSWW
jgi:hypothetical protein